MSFPHYTQLDSMDCGPTCLRIIAAFYGRHYSLQNLRDRCHITREGVSLLGISDAAESIGLRSVGVKLTWQQLRDEANFPCIVHWNQRHFVVVYKIEKKRGQWWVYVSDPAVGLLKYSERQFLKSWLQTGAEDSVLQGDLSGDSSAKGIALLLEPKPEFYAEKGDEDKRLNFASMLRYLRPYKSYLFQLGLAMLIAAVLGLILPFLTQSVVDTGIGNSNLSFVVMILIAQVVLTLGQMANNLIRSWLMLHMTTRISISLISDFLAKLMRLPIAFFDSKMVGDIMQRIGDYNRIQTFLTGSLLSIVMAAVSLVIYSVVMAGYDLGILGVFLLGSAFYIGWILIFLKRRRKLDYMRFQESANNQSNIVQLINGMQDIKLNNCEKQKRWEWERIQAKLFKVSIKSLTLGQTQEVGGTFIDQTKNVIISFLAASAVIDGEMTLGMMMAMQYIIGQLNAPISQFIGFVQATQDAKISLERLNEIQEKPDEEPEDAGLIRDIPENAAIEFRNVVFQYEGPHSDKVLDGIDLTIPHDKVTAIVGESGSGKTTIGRAILRILPTSGGEILYKGQKINGRISRQLDRQIIKEIQMIFQDPQSSLNERAKVSYIVGEGLQNVRPDLSTAQQEEKVRQALLDVGLLPEFASRFPHEFSGGQRQRIGIARALIVEPEFIVADEPISALDMSIRAQVLNLLRRLQKERGITYLFIAHDLSVMRYISDRIAVIHKGRIVELAEAEELTAHAIHPYTRSLLSAIPMPDPRRERQKKLLVYDPAMHDYSREAPQWRELRPEHFVLCSAAEAEQWLLR